MRENKFYDEQIHLLKNKHELEISQLVASHQKELVSIERHAESAIEEFESSLGVLLEQKNKEIQSLRLELKLRNKEDLKRSISKDSRN